MVTNHPKAKTPTAPSYQLATRHPWCCLWFVLPLLLLYELGVAVLAPAEPLLLRNGADTWLAWTLGQVGLGHSLWPAVALLVFLAAWAWWRRRDRPKDLASILTGMATESAVFGVGLWGLGRALGVVLSALDVPLQSTAAPDPTMARLVGFVGAGIYEEAVFRLLIFTALLSVFREADLPPLGAVALAAFCSGLAFAGAHHLGPGGEPFDGYRFAFRTLAGIYFALLFRTRGFGITVGAHTAYDMLVGVVLPSGNV